MKVQLTITLKEEEYEKVESIPDLEEYVFEVLQGQIEVPNFSHVVEWDLDTNNRRIKTTWEEVLK